MATTLANRARRLNSSGAANRLPPVFYMTDANRATDPLAVAGRLPRGCGIIVRHTHNTETEQLAVALQTIAQRRGLKILLAGDARTARRINAEGQHLSEAGVRRVCWLPARQKVNESLITCAAHSLMAVHRAANAGCRAVLISPVLPTESHPGARPLGVLRFARLARAANSRGLAVYALGGISVKTLRRLIGTGAIGVAGISGF